MSSKSGGDASGSRATSSPRRKVEKTPKSRKRARRRSSSDEMESQIDQKTEASLQQSAARNNLSKEEVKNILKKVCSNEHVVALVQIKAEDYEKNQNQSVMVVDGAEKNHSTKLTRSKARATNTDPLPKQMLPLKTPDPPPEIAALINEELCSDDEDEEYWPGDDDAQSEDDLNATASDLDSQPRTPLNSSVLTEDEGTPKFTKDGLFKIPRDRNDSFSSQTEQDYLIAQRTRSKVSLEGTPIETLESFIPPDLEADADCEDMLIDYNYIEFLSNLFNPTENADKKESTNVEEDDDDDEDFTMAVDKMPSNRDEMSNPTIPQSEYEELFKELFGDLPDLNVFDYEEGSEKTMAQQQSESQSYEKQKSIPPLKSPVGDDAFQPTQMSTPLSSIHHQPIALSSSVTSPIVPNIITNVHNTIAIGAGTCVTYPVNPHTLSPLSASSPCAPSLCYSQSTTPYTISLQHLNPYHRAVLKDGIVQLPQFQQFIITVPTLDILKSQHIQINHSQTETIPNSSLSPTSSVSEKPQLKRRNFEFLKSEKPASYDFDESIPGLTQWQRNVLDQQLRIHVQLSAQHYLMTYGNPLDNLWKEAPMYKGFLTELDSVTRNTSVKVANLSDALQLMKEWDTDLSVSSVENTAYIAQLSGNITNSSCRTFPDLMVKRILNSKVFIYPKLLPHIPFSSSSMRESYQFINAEDYLIAFGLEKYTEELQMEYSRKYSRKTKKIPVSLENICIQIKRKMFPHRLAKNTKRCAVYARVLRLRSERSYNPIKYYFQHKKAPPYQQHLEPVDVDNLTEPMNAPIVNMPPKWAKYVKTLQQNCPSTKNIQNETKPKPPTQSVTPRIRPSVSRKLSLDGRDQPTVEQTATKAEEQLNPIRIEYLHGDQVQFTYDTTQIDSINSTPKKSVEQCQIPTIRSHSTSCDSAKFNSVDVKCNLSTANAIRKLKSPRERQETQRISLLLKKLMIAKLHEVQNELRTEQRKLQRNPLLLNVLNCIRSLEIYANSLIDLKMSGTLKRNKAAVGTASTTTGAVGEDVSRKVLRPNDDYAESTTLEKDATSANSLQNRRTQKTPRTPDNVRLMLVPESPEDTNEKDSIFAQNFIDKVEEIYLSEKNSNKLAEFVQILQDFDRANGKASELYHKMENLFLPDHPELAELFLTFLTPGEAAHVGKFMEHFMLTNMSNFINKLSIFFHKQPAQTRKILSCLTELSNEPDVQMDQLRSRVLPLLKGNPLMIEWFMQCFPNDDCLSDGSADIDGEYESLNFHKASETMDDTDVYEHIPQSEILPDPIDPNPCHIRYQNGHIYYGSRILLPAKLSFMITQYSVDDDESENLTVSDEAIGSEQLQPYHCVHAIKTYGEHKLREQQRENELNTTGVGSGNCGGHCSTDDSDRTDDETFKVNSSDVCDLSIKSDENNTSGESLELLPNCCDDMTLKAHALRLNPNVHSTELIKSSELLDLLKPGASSERLSDTEKESLRISPKKQYTPKATIRKTLSPNHKKLPTASIKSPTAKKSTNAQPMLTAGVSQAVQTAKKLKKLINGNTGTSSNRKKSDIDTKISPKRSKKSTPFDDGNSAITEDTEQSTSGNNANVTSSCNDHASSNTINDYIDSPESEDDDEEEEELLSSWSRDEDKILLEQIKMGFTSEEDLVLTLQTEQLPNRNLQEIHDRFTFLMDIIANL